jgi:hypothetical protein
VLKLTEIQAMALPSLRWFFFGSRGSGRTTVMAWVLILEAVATGQEISVFDHATPEFGYHTKRNILDVIARIMEDEPHYELTISRVNSSIRVRQR